MAVSRMCQHMEIGHGTARHLIDSTPSTGLETHRRDTYLPCKTCEQNTCADS
ncbi:hypothetical protein M433DRAFT_158115 [Acidomyces richmondensis BFW]|nr:hypothetical protein M433DRAFT_160891 [Acidomyces richmondensis BFW]KYG42249.1 hypothetical protein M433DRAFT_158115 [Acidomyces richmondensis BFW]